MNFEQQANWTVCDHAAYRTKFMSIILEHSDVISAN